MQRERENVEMDAMDDESEEGDHEDEEEDDEDVLEGEFPIKFFFF